MPLAEPPHAEHPRDEEGRAEPERALDLAERAERGQLHEQARGGHADVVADHAEREERADPDVREEVQRGRAQHAQNPGLLRVGHAEAAAEAEVGLSMLGILPNAEGQAVSHHLRSRGR